MSFDQKCYKMIEDELVDESIEICPPWLRVGALLWLVNFTPTDLTSLVSYWCYKDRGMNFKKQKRLKCTMDGTSRLSDSDSETEIGLIFTREPSSSKEKPKERIRRVHRTQILACLSQCSQTVLIKIICIFEISGLH